MIFKLNKKISKKIKDNFEEITRDNITDEQFINSYIFHNLYLSHKGFESENFLELIDAHPVMIDIVIRNDNTLNELILCSACTCAFLDDEIDLYKKNISDVNFLFNKIKEKILNNLELININREKYNLYSQLSLDNEKLISMILTDLKVDLI